MHFVAVANKVGATFIFHWCVDHEQWDRRMSDVKAGLSANWTWNWI